MTPGPKPMVVGSKQWTERSKELGRLASAPNPPLEVQREVRKFGHEPFLRLLVDATLADEIQMEIAHHLPKVLRETRPRNYRPSSWTHQVKGRFACNPSLRPDLVGVLIQKKDWSGYLRWSYSDAVLAELARLGDRQTRRDIVRDSAFGPATIGMLCDHAELGTRILLAYALAEYWGTREPYRSVVYQRLGLGILQAMAEADPSRRGREHAAVAIWFHPLTDIHLVPGALAVELRPDDVAKVAKEIR